MLDFVGTGKPEIWGEHLGRKNPYGSQCEHRPSPRSHSPRLYVLGTKPHAPRPSAANQHEPDFAGHHEGNNDVAVLDRFQRYPQHGAYFVRLGLRFSGISARPNSFSIALPSRRGSGNACQLCCALQSFFFQRASHRSEHCVGLLCHQHCVVAGINETSSYSSANRVLRSIVTSHGLHHTHPSPIKGRPTGRSSAVELVTPLRSASTSRCP